MIALSGTFVVRRTRCSRDARESSDQTKSKTICTLHSQGENGLADLETARLQGTAAA